MKHFSGDGVVAYVALPDRAEDVFVISQELQRLSIFVVRRTRRFVEVQAVRVLRIRSRRIRFRVRQQIRICWREKYNKYNKYNKYKDYIPQLQPSRDCFITNVPLVRMNEYSALGRFDFQYETSSSRSKGTVGSFGGRRAVPLA